MKNISGEEAVARPILIVDLEATCWDPEESEQAIEDMEIIEIGCAIGLPGGQVERSFSTFVRPVKNPLLTNFCTRLTSITQSDVDSAPTFPEACKLVDQWLGSTRGVVWGSWGNYDRRQLEMERERHGAAPAFLDTPHVNLKRPWRKTNQVKSKGLGKALRFHGLEFEGSAHRGVDDARNVARLLKYINGSLIREEVDAWREESRK